MVTRAARPPSRPSLRRPRLLPAMLLAMGLAALGVVTGRAEDAGYVADIEDLPLMAGLVELSDSSVVFDKPAGRIIETYARGPVARAEVEDFYRDTLPQLGWREVGELSFAREGERLTIEVIEGEVIEGEVIEGGSPLTLRFTLKPE